MSRKPPSEMTRDELERECVRITGMAIPPQGASREEQDRWLVASMLVIYGRQHGPKLGALAAAGFLRPHPDWSRYAPILAEVIGRPVDDELLAEGAKALELFA